MKLYFTKMCGALNDFIIIDNRKGANLSLSAQQIQRLCDRRLGIGADQLFLLQNPTNSAADVKAEIFNMDGQKVEQCGNGLRCVALFASELKHTNSLAIETDKGLHSAIIESKDRVAINMGKPSWENNAFFESLQRNQFEILDDNLDNPMYVNFGNPHLVLWSKSLDSLKDLDISTVGSRLERHEAFPEGTNVQFAYCVTPTMLQMAVWERGAGLTGSCGSGACAAVACGHKRGLLSGTVSIKFLSGGEMEVRRDEVGDYWLAGTALKIFQGEFCGEL